MENYDDLETYLKRDKDLEDRIKSLSGENPDEKLLAEFLNEVVNSDKITKVGDEMISRPIDALIEVVHKKFIKTDDEGRKTDNITAASLGVK